MTALAGPAFPEPPRLGKAGIGRAAIWLVCLALVLALLQRRFKEQKAG